MKNNFSRLVIVSFVTGKQVTARDEPKMVLFTTNISDSQILTVSFEENSFDIDLNSVARKNDRRTAT